MVPAAEISVDLTKCRRLKEHSNGGGISVRRAQWWMGAQVDGAAFGAVTCAKELLEYRAWLRVSKRVQRKEDEK